MLILNLNREHFVEQDHFGIEGYEIEGTKVGQSNFVNLPIS